MLLQTDKFKTPQNVTLCKITTVVIVFDTRSTV